MPFGLNIAPESFTKLADSDVKQLRQKGIQVATYLDSQISSTTLDSCMEMRTNLFGSWNSYISK